jgi:molybdopterin/thiamine biosynthesis adenylyltransferase
MTDEQLLRYARHLMLDDLGVEGQQRLLAAHALVIGAGGLGSPVSMTLGAAGVGRLTVVDDDVVDPTNLQRQVAHDLSRLGLPKALSIQATVRAINPDPQVTALTCRADAALLDEWVPQADVVLDCSDSFATRHAVNAACVRHRRPLVSGAALGWDGQLAVFDARDPQAPCYACLFPPDAGHRDQACATMGVFAPLVALVGCLQAAQALKLLAGMGAGAGAEAGGPRGTAPRPGELLMIDLRGDGFDRVRFARRPDCPVCGHATGSA